MSGLDELFNDPDRRLTKDKLAKLTGGTMDHIHVITPVKAICVGFMYPELIQRVQTTRCPHCAQPCWYDPRSTEAPGRGRLVCFDCVERGVIGNFPAELIVVIDVTTLLIMDGLRDHKPHSPTQSLN